MLDGNTNRMLSCSSDKVLSMETYLSNDIESFVFYLRKFKESAYCLVGMVFDGLNSNLNHMPISPHVVVTQLANY